MKRTRIFTALTVLLGCVTVGLSWRSLRPLSAAAATAPPAATGARSGRVIHAEGRVAAVPGSDTTVGAPQAGIVERVSFKDGDQVKEGDLLLEFEHQETIAEAAEARAQLRAAESQLAYCRTEEKRSESLNEAQVIARVQLERARFDCTQNSNRLAETRARVLRIEARVAKTRVLAPHDGVIVERFVHPSEVVQLATPLFRVVDMKELRIEAEIDEYDAHLAKLGMSAKVEAEGYPQPYTAEVIELPPSVGARRLRPDDPARPVDVRVLLAKLALHDAHDLRLGQRVEVQLTVPN